jgi:RHS repeat-associated protein
LAEYDALGNRVIFDGRIFIPDHNDPLKRPLVEATINGSPIRYYIWGPGRLLGFINAADNSLTIAHSDEQGSVIALTDIQGNVLHTAHYDPHGQDWSNTGTNPTPFAWLGGWGVMKVSGGDSPFELYLTRHRLYSATHARFLSPDPLGLAGGLNQYQYAEGNPLAFIDPSGLCAESGGRGFLGDFGEGFLKGDLSDRDGGWGQTAGEIVGGLVPLYGQFADARDIAANARNVAADPSDKDAWIGLGAAALGLVPAVGDAAKSAVKAGREAAKEAAQAAAKTARYSDDAAALIDLSKQAKKTGTSTSNADTLLNWADEYNVVPALNHTTPPLHWDNTPHIRIGPVNHIEVKP